jgi:NTP pyrophosphatase (non-canonical NTP hydrolase)
MPRQLSLDDLYKMVAHIYSEQNAHRPARETFAHFVEVCGMLALNDRQKKREEVTVESALCKALGWYLPLMAKFRVSSVEELVFRKFPYACPYCRLCPHDDAKCKTVKGTTKTVDHAAVRDLYQKNASRRPITLNEWQAMFQAIYPRNIEDRSGRSTVGLLEELGELAEAVRVFERHPKYFAGEAADVFSYIMGLANEYGLRLERDTDNSFSFEDEFIQRYPGMCVQCGYPVCVCPLIPEATVGRLAKELDIKPLEPLFGFDQDRFAKEAKDTSTAVLERLGGYVGLAQKFPFDRGEANKALILFCLRAAEAVQSENSDVAERLRSAAMKIGMAATYAGSKKRPQQMTDLITAIQTAIPEIGTNKADVIMSPVDKSLTGQLGRILSPKVTRVLLVFANPEGSTPLRLQAEERVIREAIQLAKARDTVELKTLAAATVDDLRRELLAQDYRIVHFSGHGQPGALLFETAEGGTVKSPLEALAALLNQYSCIECVVLNACYSLAQLLPVAPFTIGMEKPIDDRAAIEFARGFYDAIVAGKDYARAAQEGFVNVRLKDLQDDFPLKVLP